MGRASKPLRPPRRGHDIAVWLGALLAVLAVLFVSALLWQDLTGKSPWLRAAPADRALAERPAMTAQPRGSGARILSCEADDGSPFYTNAASCEAADLNQRVTVVPASVSSDSKPDASRCLGAQPGGARAQGFLGACFEPFNAALELEPALLQSAAPASTATARRYCDLITSGVQAGCLATSAQFCFLPMCQQLRESGR